MRKCSSNFSINDNSDIIISGEFRKPRSIPLAKFGKEKNKKEYVKEAEKFLSNIQLKTKEEMVLENQIPSKPNIKKINLPNKPNKIDEYVKELMGYSKEQSLKDAENYLTKISKVNEDNDICKERSSKFKRTKTEYLIEVEESEGLKLIKLDSFKMSYYFHLEMKTNYNFSPILLFDTDDVSQEVSEFKRYKSNNSSKNTCEILNFHDLRKLKYYLFFKICVPLELDIYIACCAWVYFEFLVKKGVVVKKNRNLYLCVAFMLTLKFYDIDDERYVDNFYELCSKIFKGNIKRKDIIENEMKVFGNLNFSLYLPLEIVDRHLDYTKRKIINNKMSLNSEKHEMISLYT